MIEYEGDLWDLVADATVITTNGFVKSNGRAVMGRGCAREARDRYKDLPASNVDELLGYLLKTEGNHVHDLGLWKGRRLITFPTKHHWREASDLELIMRSSGELVVLANTLQLTNIAMPRPGCGSGRRRWSDVRPLIEEVLDDRFIVCHLSGD